VRRNKIYGDRANRQKERRPEDGRSGVALSAGRFLLGKARHELPARRKDVRIVDADGIAGARRILRERFPRSSWRRNSVLVEEKGRGSRGVQRRLSSALSPSGWVRAGGVIGAAGEALQTTLAVRSGAVDFVPGARRCCLPRGDHPWWIGG